MAAGKADGMDFAGQRQGSSDMSSDTISHMAAGMHVRVVVAAAATSAFATSSLHFVGAGACNGSGPAAAAVKIEAAPAAAPGSGRAPLTKAASITVMTGLISALPQPGVPQQPGAPHGTDQRAAANRQSAARSKQRRRAYIAGLEQNIRRLEQQSLEQQGHLHGLAANISSLRALLPLHIGWQPYCAASVERHT